MIRHLVVVTTLFSIACGHSAKVDQPFSTMPSEPAAVSSRGTVEPTVSPGTQLLTPLPVASRDAPVPTTQSEKLSGAWGGDHIEMRVAAEKVLVEWDCAHGWFPTPTLNPDGAFTVEGGFALERGGPTRKQDSDAMKPATYSGLRKDHQMTVTLRSKGAEPLTFVVTEGEKGRLFKCR